MDKYTTSVPPSVMLPLVSKIPKCLVAKFPLLTEPDIEALNWEQYHQITGGRKQSTCIRRLAALKPLYGGRDAPPRRYIRAIATLRMAGWGKDHADICTSAKSIRLGGGNFKALPSIILTNVGDLLLSAGDVHLSEFAMATRQF